MDALFEELVGVDYARAFDFFSVNLRAIVKKNRYNLDEMLYVASVLAHYTMVSRQCTESMPVLADLSEVFDVFIFREQAITDSEILAIGGSQVLFFAGYFRSQMARRHNVNWYDQVGQSFYDRAGRYAQNRKAREFFGGLAETFPWWTTTCSELQRNLHENRLLLKQY